MTREALVDHARFVGKAAKHNLKIVRQHPERMLPDKRKEQEGHLTRMIMFYRYEKKNARRGGRTSLRTRLRNLVASIIAHI